MSEPHQHALNPSSMRPMVHSPSSHNKHTYERKKNSEEGFMGALRSCSHFLIHSLYLLLYTCYFIYHHVWERLLSQMFVMLLGINPSSSPTSRYTFSPDKLNEDMISKFPNHLAIAIDTEMLSPHVLHHDDLSQKRVTCLDEIAMKQIQNMIYWSLTTFSKLKNHSIQSIAFYDKYGILEKHATQIFTFIERVLKNHEVKFTAKNIQLLETKQNIEHEIPCLKISTKNIVHNHTQTLVVRLLSFQNCGKPSITKLANSIFEELKHKQDMENLKELVRHHVSEKLHRHTKENIPEPNMLISFSTPVLLLHGFSPLHLKYTQISHVEKCFVTQFTEQDFVKCVLEYVSCNQRFGK
ncbi:hypothetical protein FDP41_001414 [Naegleria fowleri]|uniref:ditrans,polycis-polyprenyl diphosphate synthase [(2E,6E)-farnesyldiphosphate specific] n=1 Tax=Naegleria fowleri TaxID=5763 RepID=A0A6A5C119_NAEFO|nr:uncharacterized protein FDP41_001414 [Naegleria fowleri]KAF0979550.1 hypothetical protein FDP41_001414 [Naegleria fowleri]CAG4716399.1 unnamed protein product [Naegleria fowleri]